MITITSEGPPKTTVTMDPAAVLGVRIVDRAAMVRDYAAVEVLVTTIGWVLVQRLQTFEEAQEWVTNHPWRGMNWVTAS